MKKKILAAILAAVMIVCLLPAAAFAAGESGIQLGTVGLKAKDEVYFGNYTDGTTYDVPWIVLNKGASEAALLSKYLLGSSQFRSSGSGYYSGGTLNARMDALYNGAGASLFTTQEQGAIAAVTSLDCVDGGYASSPSVSNAHLYPLSFNEAAALGWGNATLKFVPYITDQSGSAGWWWLRSLYDDIRAYCVASLSGNYNYRLFDVTLGVRPAFHLDLSKVLFISTAVGDKASGTAGAGALKANLPPSSSTNKNTWKLTLLDSTRTFNVTTTTVSATTAGGNVSVAYSGAKVGASTAPEYLSAMLVDGSNNVLYYGRLKSIATSADASGTQSITIPALSVGAYTLKIFNEQYNGDYDTDYSSAFKDVTLTVTGPANPTITAPTSDQIVTAAIGSTGTLSVTAQNATGYQWYVNRNDGQDFAAISGAENARHTTSAVTTANDGYQYRCIVSGAAGTTPVTSPTFTLRVVEQPDIPATGDHSQPGLWIGTAMLAALGLAGIAALRSRKRRGEH